MKRIARLAFVLCATTWLSMCGGGGDSGEDGSGAVTSWGETGSESGSLDAPAGFCSIGEGRVLVADTNNHRIQEFRSTGKFVSEWGEEGAGPGQFSYPAAVAVDRSGDIYVADAMNNRIQKFDVRHDFVREWGAQGTENGQFLAPFDLALDASNNSYVADSGNSRVQVFSADGQFVRSFGEEGSAPGQLLHPGGIAISPSGQVYVADTDNHRIQVFSETGTYLAGWGVKGSGSGQVKNPIRVDMDAQENVYVVDHGNGRVQKFSSTGSYLGEWGGPAGGQATNLFDVIVRGGRVLVLDEGGNRVHVLRPGAMQPKTVAGREEDEKGSSDRRDGETEEVLQDDSSWMTEISATIIDKNLKEVVIPGTHDSGTWAITPQSAWAHDGNPNHAQQVIDALNQKLGSWSDLLKPLEPLLYDQAVVFQAGWSKTQYKAIGDQLAGGIRYLDLRVSWEAAGNDNGQTYAEGFYLVHSMRGDSLQNALNNVRDFARAHPQEIILLDFNHMYYNDSNGAMTDSQIQAFDSMVTGTLVYEDGKSMLVREDNGSDISVREIWNRGQQILAFAYDSRLTGNDVYWSSVNDVRSEWDETDDLGNLRAFLTGEMAHIEDGLFHVSQSIRTETETDIINGAITWLYNGLDGHTTTQWVVRKFVDHYGYSVDAPQNILSFESQTLASISTYTGWIGAQYQGPKIQIINNFGDDVVYKWWLESTGTLTAPGYVEYAKQLNINYFGDGGPEVNLVGKTTLDDTTQGPPSLAALNNPELTEYVGILVYGSTDSPRKVVTRGLTDQWTGSFDERHVWNETTSTFPTAGSFGNDNVIIAWTGVGNNYLNYFVTQDGWTSSNAYTDTAETSSSYPVRVASFNGDLVAVWQGGDGRMNVKRYLNGNPESPGAKKTLTEMTWYGASAIDAGGTLQVTGTYNSGPFFLLSFDTSYNYTGWDFSSDWTNDTVSVAYIHGYTVLAWRGQADLINLYIKGDQWYKRVFQESSPSAPCIANINGMLYIVWRGGDNRINAAIIAGL